MSTERKLHLFKNLVLVLATGYIFVYYSEFLFWSRPRPGDSLAGWAGAWLAYSLLAFVFLTILGYFRVHSQWAIFLAGAVFGWLAEGVVVQTAYEMLPLSISFTGLAWHALITVWVGWYAVQASLHSPNRFAALKLSALIGLGAGLWAVSWWSEPDGGVTSLAGYAAFTFVTALLAVLAYALAAWSAAEPFAPNRWIVLVVAGLFVAYFILVAVPAAPLAVVILPLLLGLAFFGLWRSRRKETGPTLLERFAAPLPLWSYAGLLALPLASVAVYALALSLDLRWQTNWVLYLVATPLGFIIFGLSLYKTVRKL
jgi:hypothetical protein